MTNLWMANIYAGQRKTEVEMDLPLKGGSYEIGAEFVIARDLKALGVEPVVPRTINISRNGRRHAGATVRPYLERLVFFYGGGEAWHAAKSIKGVYQITDVSAGKRSIEHFFDAVESDFAERLSQIMAGDRISEYAPGDMLEIITGPWAGRILEFAGVVEDAQGYPQIVARAELFGKEARVPFDPTWARRAAE